MLLTRVFDRQEIVGKISVELVNSWMKKIPTPSANESYAKRGVFEAFLIKRSAWHCLVSSTSPVAAGLEPF
jgi:hypothetical protein